MFTRILGMTVINFEIICNWSNEESAPKRICSPLEEQLADSTSKTLHLGNKKIKNYNCSRPPQVPNDVCFNLQGHIITTRNEQRRCQNKPCTATGTSRSRKKY